MEPEIQAEEHLTVMGELEAKNRTLTAELASARAVLRALGFEGERLKLAEWASERGMTLDGDFDWIVGANPALSVAADGSNSVLGYFIPGCAVEQRHFDAGQHESAWAEYQSKLAAFNAARGAGGGSEGN